MAFIFQSMVLTRTDYEVRTIVCQFQHQEVKSGSLARLGGISNIFNIHGKVGYFAYWLPKSGSVLDVSY